MDNPVTAQFAVAQRTRATQVLLRFYGRPVTNREEPLLELISLALQSDETGGITPPPNVPVDWKSWDNWVCLQFCSQDLLVQALLYVMEREDAQVPENPGELPVWAAQLVNLTLDELGELEY
jgi:hypothetical protein